MRAYRNIAETESPHTGSFWSFPTWGALLEALPGVLEVGESYYTLAFDLGVSRISRTVPASWLPLVLREWAAQYPQPREVRIYRGEVEVSTVWPLAIMSQFVGLKKNRPVRPLKKARCLPLAPLSEGP
ncbi:hypothetical protein [Meiothermus sp.]|uniref:hypothetical protein n=1 Tax=Meiothermus sp. TaxID=1955249 RepID=UPI0021DF280D|nr:hypothetical protein [Meiothermus sp.]GIW24746.1 MAG: hypothetical protein KatS3mg069_1013 [Meiothermus sp.]